MKKENMKRNQMEKTRVTEPDSIFRNRQRKIAGKKRTAAALSALIALMCVTGALYACGKKNSGASGEPAVSQGDASGSGFEKIEGNAAGTGQADIPADSILRFKDDPGLKRLVEDMKAGDIPVDCNVLYDTMGARPDVTVRDAGKIREIFDCLSRMTVGQKSSNSVTDSYHHVTFHLRNDSYVSCYFEGENLLSWGQEKYEVSGGDALWSCIMELQDDVMADEKKAAEEAEKAAAAASAEKAKELAAEEEKEEKEEEEDNKEAADAADSAKKAASEKTSKEESKAGVKKTVTKKTTIKKDGSGKDSTEQSEKKSQTEKKTETEKKAESEQTTETKKKTAGGNTGLEKLPAKQEDVNKTAEQKKDTGKDKPAGKETEKKEEKPAEQGIEDKTSTQDTEKEKEKPAEQENDEEKPAEQEQENGEGQPAEQNPEDREEQPDERDSEDGEEQPAEQDPENGEEQSDRQENEEEQPTEHSSEPAETAEASDKKEGIEELPAAEVPEEDVPEEDVPEEAVEKEVPEEKLPAEDLPDTGTEEEEDSEEEKDGLQKQDIDTEKTEGPVQDAAALDTAALDAVYTEIIRAYSAVLAQDPETFLQAYESGVYSEGAESAEAAERTADAEAVDGRLNYEMIREAMARPDGNGVYYGLRDYNGDGTPELVIALGTEEFKHIWAGYTFDGTKAVPLFTGHTGLGYRIDLFTLPDNTFLIHGSGGATAGRDTICRISDSKIGLEILAEYDYDEQANGNMDHIGASETLTDEEFQERYWANIVEAAKGAAFYRLAEDASVKTAEQAPAAAPAE